MSVATVASALAGGPSLKEKAAGDWDVVLGIGPAFEPEFEGSDALRINALPILEVKWRDEVFLSADDGLGWNAFKTPNFRIGPVLTHYLGSSNYFGTHDRPTGISEIDPGIQIGAFSEFAFDHFKIDAKALYAIYGSSEGLRINMGASIGSRIEKDWAVILRVDTTWLNDNEMKTYFGISQREASGDGNSGLAQYRPGMGFKDIGLGMDLTYEISKVWSVLGRAKLSYLLGDAADSPLVTTGGSEVQAYGGLSLGYRF
jgi:outer membrane protein